MQGYVSDRRSPFYVALLLPLITLKQGIELVRGFLHRLIWSELRQQATPKEPDPIQELMMIFSLGIFCLVCVASYKFYPYYSAISVFIGGCWYIDLVLSQRNYARKLPVHLTLAQDNYYTWKLQSAHSQKFHRSNLKGIGISQVKILSGAFETAIAQPWQIFLMLENRAIEGGTNLIIYEDIQTLKILAKARELSQSLQVPITFLNADRNHQINYSPNWQCKEHSSESSFEESLSNKSTPNDAAILWNPRAAFRETPRETKHNPKGIAIQKQPSKWHIFSNWNSASSGYFFGRVFDDAGFLLFALFLTEFMSRCGRIIDTMISIYHEQGAIYINFDNLLSSYSFSWLRVLEVAIATGIMIWRGIQISQVKHIYINADHLKYGINRKAIAQLNLASLESIVLIKRPEPQILIFDDQKTIEIKDLLTSQDYEDMFSIINEGILHHRETSNAEANTNQKSPQQPTKTK